MIITNQCPWCKPTFATRRNAVDHATRAATWHGICHINRSSWNFDVQDVSEQKLVCQICNHQAQDVEGFQAHVIIHRRGPTTIRYPKNAGRHGDSSAGHRHVEVLDD